MKQSELIEKIGEKESDKGKIAARVAKKTAQIPEILLGLGADTARVKYGCAKVLRILSGQHPKVLYPHLDFFINLLEHENDILQWEAIHVISDLAAVDRKNKIDGILDRYLEPIRGPVLITAANTIGGAGRIAAAKPHLAARITSGILKVGRARYKTTECRNIAFGHAIDAFDHFFEQIEDPKPVLAMVRRQLKNSRNSTRKKAEKFLKKRAD